LKRKPVSDTPSPELPDAAPQATPPAAAKTPTAKPAARLRKWAGHAATAWKAASIVILGAVLAAYVLNVIFLDRNLNLALIGVPDSLRSAGFTSAVATQRMEDAINGIEDQANTTRSASTAISDQDRLNVTIPGVGITFQGLTATLRYFFHTSESQITGEFVATGNQLSLQLRLNGRTIFYKTITGNDADAANSLIYDGEQGGAFQIVQATQPYIAASALDSWGEEEPALLAADNILNAKTLSASDIAYSYNLRGLITYKTALISGNTALIANAMSDFSHAPEISIAHDNLGNLYDIPNTAWRNQDKAVAEFNAALNISPQDSRAYNGLGNVYREEADARRAQADPAAALADFNAAIADYNMALLWDPKYPAPYAGLAALYADPLYQDKNAVLAAQDKSRELYFSIAAMTKKADMFERFSDYSVDPVRKTLWLGKACIQLISAQTAISQTSDAGLQGMALIQAALTARIADVNTQLAGQASCPPAPLKPH
jgi:tetratricopeptide (TPR) repeat protein